MPPRILYIAGYSRSGSTLVDMILNSGARIVSTGELTYLQDEAAAGRRCTCGAPFGSCARYGPWLATRPAGEAHMVRRVEGRANLARLVSGTVAAEDARAYRDYARRLFTHIGTTAGAELVVDSSKSARDAAGRPLALSRLAGLALRVLHLTRVPRRTVQSYVERGSNRVLEGRRAKRAMDSWRPIRGWRIANRIARQTGRDLGPDRYLHLRFEDVLADPVAALRRIGDFAAADLSAAIERVRSGEPIHAGHMVGGNRTRLAPQRVARGAPAPARLPLAHGLCLDLIDRPLAREFGYD